MNFEKDLIAESARAGNIRVTFTKVNGDVRIMNCTLRAESLPRQTDLEEHTTKKNPNVLAVWDIDSVGWRSFRIDSVTAVEKL